MFWCFAIECRRVLLRYTSISQRVDKLVPWDEPQDLNKVPLSQGVLLILAFGIKIKYVSILFIILKKGKSCRETVRRFSHQDVYIWFPISTREKERNRVKQKKLKLQMYTNKNYLLPLITWSSLYILVFPLTTIRSSFLIVVDWKWIYWLISFRS